MRFCGNKKKFPRYQNRPAPRLVSTTTQFISRLPTMDTPTFITFMVMWMLLLFGILGIVLSYRHRRHLIDLAHKERLTALERGLEAPPLLSHAGGFRNEAPAASCLHRGLIFTLLGLSLMAALGVNAGTKSALWGLPATALGVAYLILYVVTASKEKRT